MGLSERFSVLPLLAALQADSRAHVLALSEKSVRVFEFRSGNLRSVDVPDLPADMESTLQLDPSPSLQGHIVSGSAQGNSPVEGVHGHGGGKDKQEAYRTEFFQRVDSAVRAHLQDSKAPLFLATVRANQGLYHRISDCPQLSEDFVEGNFDDASANELADALKPVLERHRQQRQNGLMDDLEEAVGAGLVADQLPDIIRSSHEGRMREILIESKTDPVTGHWNAESFEARLDDEPDPLHANLVDKAAAETWRQGGSVYVLPEGKMDSDRPWVGILRWKT